MVYHKTIRLNKTRAKKQKCNDMKKNVKKLAKYRNLVNQLRLENARRTYQVGLEFVKIRAWQDKTSMSRAKVYCGNKLT